MAELTADSGAGQAVRTSFFFWMTVAMAAVVYGGFGLSYFLPMAQGNPLPLHPLVHIHGFFYFAWMVLLVVQAYLVNHKNMALHRSLGMLGISIGTALAIFGLIITLHFAARLVAAEDQSVYGLTYIGLIAVLTFAIVFALAIHNIRDGAAHKRYILLATSAFIMGGVNRWIDFFFDIGFDSHWDYLPRYLGADLFILALAVYDWRSLGRLHPATIIGAIVIIAPQVLHPFIVESGPYMALTYWLAGMIS
jgi:hypothetical protein